MVEPLSATPAALLERLRERGGGSRRSAGPSPRRSTATTSTSRPRRSTGARAILPEVSLATVYNTLNELVAMGEIAEVRYVPGPSRYDPNVGPQPHHHLLCTSCGALFDVNAAGVTVPDLAAAECHGFLIDGAEVLFRGTCPTCRAAA